MYPFKICNYQNINNTVQTVKRVKEITSTFIKQIKFNNNSNCLLN